MGQWDLRGEKMLPAIRRAGGAAHGKNRTWSSAHLTRVSSVSRGLQMECLISYHSPVK